MGTFQHRPFMTVRPVSAFPWGWYAILPSKALAPGAVEGFTLADRSWVAFRTERGEARVAFNRCAHLGGRFDRAGRVVGEQLSCGLHGYRFGIDGRPAGRHRGACRLNSNLEMLETVERHGMVFAYFDDDAGPSRFSLPILDESGWAPWTYRYLDVQTRPEIIIQDLADRLHFETVHRYDNVEVEEGPTYCAHRMVLKVKFDWDTGLPGPLGAMPSRFVSQCHGLGYQLTEVSALGGRFRTRHLVLPRPVDEHTTRVYLGTTTKWHGMIGERIGPRFANRLSQTFIVWAFLRDVRRDARLWELQSNHMRASLAPDAEIHSFRTWARGFKGA